MFEPEAAIENGLRVLYVILSADELRQFSLPICWEGIWIGTHNDRCYYNDVAVSFDGESLCLSNKDGNQLECCPLRLITDITVIYHCSPDTQQAYKSRPIAFMQKLAKSLK